MSREQTRRSVEVHDDGSVSWTIDGDGDGDVEWRVTVGPPVGDYTPVLPEQREWLSRVRKRQ